MKLISTESLRCVTLTEIEARKRLQFLYDSRKIYEANRFAEGIVTSESQIAHFRAICIGIEKFGPQEAFGKPETQEQVLERLRNAYQMAIEKEGEVSCLMEGANLALELNNAHHKIAAWRLLKKLITGSKQQHGREHHQTQRLELILIKCKTAYVELEVLRYEADKYVVCGPNEVAEKKR
jgi:hypothetical protein